MTYELAKELKEAGFPQPLRSAYCAHDELVCPARTCLDADYVVRPSLSELIEACGGNLHALEQLTNEEEVTGWAAYLRPGTTLPKSCYHGLTPEEAVARLYIALNKK